MDPNKNLLNLIEDLEKRVKELEEKYSDALIDIKRLEEEMIATTNSIYEVANSIESRIDILASEPYTNLERFSLDK
jgi:peptidoglycan hydrolase CwlO-like protein